MAVQQLQHTHGTSVVPSDTLYLYQSLGYPYRVTSALFVGVGGSVRVLTEGGDDVVFSSVPDGTFMPVHVVKVFATGTTASSIVAVDLSNLSPFIGLLDAYSGAAAAYSLRQLSSSYSGSAIRVRRASDNTEQNIGFSNNELDTTTLASFCSGTNGFVTTWYDQSGNGYNATQTTAAYQPQIVSSGNVILENSKPILRFNNNYFIISSVLLNNTNLSIYFATLAKTSYSYGGILTNKLNSQDNANAINYLNNGKIEAVYQYSNAVTQTNLQTSLFQGTALYDSTNITLRTNGVQDATALKTGTQNFGNATWMGSYRLDTNNLGNFVLSEVIVYQSNQSANNTSIENNIKNYYAI